MHEDNKKKHTGRTALILLLALVLICAVTLFAGYKKFKSLNGAVDPASMETLEFTVPKGSGTAKIATLLKDAGLIDNINVFKIKSRICKYDGKYQAGVYELSPSMGLNDIMIALQDAKRETVKFTIKEGLTLRQIAAALEEQGIVSKEDFYKSLENDSFDYRFVSELKERYPDPSGELSAKANRFEGFLFPNTYEVYKGASAGNVVNKMLAEFDEIFTETMKSRMKEKGLSLNELVSIASIIEKEIQVDSERALCASVIYNRLNSNATGRKLEMCSSVLYCLGNPEGKTRVLYKDLEIDSPYNTYKYPGLPPAPICSPGKACLEAALNPADTNYLYFVVNSEEDGTHRFTASYKEHVYYSDEYHKNN